MPPNREIERKYLLNSLPERVADARVLEIDQGYLPGVWINERIRRTKGDDGTHYFRTIKSGKGIERLEIEEETDEAFFLAVWPLTRGKRIAKRRYLVPEGEVTWEIDEFVDRADFWLAEVELERVDQMVTIPPWLRDCVNREVTDEPGFTNHALAR